MYVCDALFHHSISINNSFSFAVEEIAWIEKQHELYSEVKLNVRTSFFWDFFFTGKNTLKAFNDLATEKMVKLIAEKLGDFLKSKSEFQQLDMDQQRLVVKRNVSLALCFICMTVEWIEDGENQILFFRKLLTSFSGTDIFLKYLKPEKFSLTDLNQVFCSPAHKLQFQNVMLSLKAIESLTIFEMEMFTVAILFHTEFEDNMPNIHSYNNFILKTLQRKNNYEYDVFNFVFQFTNNHRKVFSSIEMIENLIQSSIANLEKEMFQF